ncbi:MAG: Gfo/Idh/MocA family oxidoreductase [Verrucomicrobiae bacterium]|nr:Gfo/Idh/MocA family oxidoreductase [Verrucomicrobiae bacterium]
MLRFGLIACSSIARRRFVPALKRSAHARLERVGSRDPARAEAFAREVGCAKFGTYEEVLSDPEVDAVYISTPIAQHDEWAQRAAEAGKHILCEKTAFRSHAVAREIVALCARRGVRLMEAFSFRYHPQHALVQQLLGEGRIGTAKFFHGELTFPRPAAGDFRLDPDRGGGAFYDAACYPVAAALMTLGARPAAVSAQLHLEAETGVDDAAAITVVFEGGAVAQCVAGFGLHFRSRYSVLGTGGRIELERAYAIPPDRVTGVVVETDPGTERIELPAVDVFELMIGEFATEVQSGRRERDFEGRLLQQSAVMDAALRSHREGRIIPLNGYGA